MNLIFLTRKRCPVCFSYIHTPFETVSRFNNWHNGGASFPPLSLYQNSFLLLEEIFTSSSQFPLGSTIPSNPIFLSLHISKTFQNLIHPLYPLLISLIQYQILDTRSLRSLYAINFKLFPFFLQRLNTDKAVMSSRNSTLGTKADLWFFTGNQNFKAGKLIQTTKKIYYPHSDLLGTIFLNLFIQDLTSLYISQNIC